MAAPIKSPAKCEVRSVIIFLSAKGERPAEILKQIVAVYSKVMNRQNVRSSCREFCEGRTDVHGEQRSGRPSLISGRRQTSMTRGYRSWFQDLINVWTMPATMLKNKVIVQAIHSQCRFCKLKMLYMFKTFVSLLSGYASCSFH
jgi:hypothetical protein